MIKKCSCKHEYQDKKHGKGMRVMTPFKRTDTLMARCTVCLKEQVR